MTFNNQGLTRTISVYHIINLTFTLVFFLPFLMDKNLQKSGDLIVSLLQACGSLDGEEMINCEFAAVTLYCMMTLT